MMPKVKQIISELGNALKPPTSNSRHQKRLAKRGTAEDYSLSKVDIGTLSTVLLQAKSGATDQELATELGVSVATIRRRRKHLTQALGISKRNLDQPEVLNCIDHIIKTLLHDLAKSNETIIRVGVSPILNRSILSVALPEYLNHERIQGAKLGQSLVQVETIEGRSWELVEMVQSGQVDIALCGFLPESIGIKADNWQQQLKGRKTKTPSLREIAESEKGCLLAAHAELALRLIVHKGHALAQFDSIDVDQLGGYLNQYATLLELPRILFEGSGPLENFYRAVPTVKREQVETIEAVHTGVYKDGLRGAGTFGLSSAAFFNRDEAMNLREVGIRGLERGIKGRSPDGRIIARIGLLVSSSRLLRRKLPESASVERLASRLRSQLLSIVPDVSRGSMVSNFPQHWTIYHVRRHLSPVTTDRSYGWVAGRASLKFIQESVIVGDHVVPRTGAKLASEGSITYRLYGGATVSDKGIGITWEGESDEDTYSATLVASVSDLRNGIMTGLWVGRDTTSSQFIPSAGYIIAVSKGRLAQPESVRVAELVHLIETRAAVSHVELRSPTRWAY